MKKLLIISIFFLSICILIGSRQISNVLNEISRNQDIEINKDAFYKNPQLLTETDLESYLGLSQIELKALQLNAEKNKNPIPVYKINGKNFYPIKGVDRWLVSVNGE